MDPNCNILSDNARALASGSVQILENAKIYSTVKECVADLQRVFATTVRPRREYSSFGSLCILSVRLLSC